MQTQEKSELGIHGHRGPGHEDVGLAKVASPARLISTLSRRNCSMIRFRSFLPFIGAALVGAVVIGASTPAHADITIRATDINSGGIVVNSQENTLASAANGAGVGNLGGFTGIAVGNFTITIVTDIATTGPGFPPASTTVNITYDGPVDNTGTPTNESDTLLIEVLGTKFSNPTAPALSFISSNSSPSTSGLLASSVTMTSGVIAGNVALSATTGTTLGGQLGTTTGSGTMGSASSVLMPNPVTGAGFNIVNPFSFYQTYTITGFTNSGVAGSLSAGSTVTSAPEPGGGALALTGLSVMAGLGWWRRRKTLPSA